MEDLCLCLCAVLAVDDDEDQMRKDDDGLHHGENENENLVRGAENGAGGDVKDENASAGVDDFRGRGVMKEEGVA